MLTVEIRINSSLVEHLYVRNIGCNIPGYCNYAWERYRVGEGVTASGKVAHRWDDGALQLVRLVVEEARKQEADHA